MAIKSSNASERADDGLLRLPRDSARGTDGISSPGASTSNETKPAAADSAPKMTPADFAEAFLDVYRTLWTIAAGIVNDRAIAEDVVQDAAVTALSKLNDFDPRTNFTAWMAKIVRFLALNQSRRGRKQPANVDPVSMDDSMPARSEQNSSVHSPIDAAGRLDARQEPFDDELLHALNSVSDLARACLLLRTIEGLTYDQISRALEIPPGTAMSHVHRTRMLLRDRLSKVAPGADAKGGLA